MSGQAERLTQFRLKTGQARLLYFFRPNKFIRTGYHES